MKAAAIRIEQWDPHCRSRVIEEFLERAAFDAKAERTARRVLDEIRRDGDAAVAKYARQFDGVDLDPAEFSVPRRELTRAREKVDGRVKEAVRMAHRRITAFATRGLKQDWSMPSPRGGTLGEQFRPLDRVGVYVPGGAAPLVSTALMTATLARVAGVPEVVACTPCGEDKKVNPALLHALEVAGATEIYRVGGVQAIGLMAYGTQTVRPVQKLVGPGGTYVTAAKRQVYGHVALDMVVADETADPRHIAADLLSQAEHGTGFEKALLVTPLRRLAEAVREQLLAQAATLSRQECVKRVLQKGTLLAVTSNLDEGMALCNRFAPEHLELMVREPKTWLRKVERAGAVFVGAWSPEAVGDFVAGPSHVLPTGGTAALFSGLTVDDFRRRTSFVAFTRADLQDVLEAVETFGAVEGLDAHARSARVRFEG
jgi:histidinol dehydrogenase